MHENLLRGLLARRCLVCTSLHVYACLLPWAWLAWAPWPGSPHTTHASPKVDRVTNNYRNPLEGPLQGRAADPDKK